MEESKSATILSLHIEGVKRISVVDISPSPVGSVDICGQNEAGKSSVLESIEVLLRGLKKGQRPPINVDADKAKIIGEFGTFRVTRTLTDKNAYLVVERSDGKVARPQEFLDSLVGSGLGFDPFMLLRKKPAEAVSMMLDALHLEQDPRKLDAEIDDLYTKRTQVNRDAQALKARAMAIPLRTDLPAEEIPTAEIVLAQQAMLEQRRAYADAQKAIQVKQADLDKQFVLIESLKSQLVEAERQASFLVLKIEEASDDAEKLPNPDDAEIAQKLVEAQTQNEAIRQQIERKRFILEVMQ